ncbi:MAG: diguanylate cyclase and metal dependent phosphohydrolase, partial [Actinomycetia bacterium]|nr:diguanylate cyclase and metal dependent phosphohydrolase [Actinomycetes bacterium]
MTATAPPLAGPQRLPDAGRWVPGLVAVGLLAFRHLLGLGGLELDPGFFALYSLCEFAAAVLCVSRALRYESERVAWLLLGLGTFASFVGDSLEYALYGNGSYPSPGLLDAFWLANYPLAAAGLVALVAARFPKPEPARWLEALQAALLVAALGLLAVFQPVLDEKTRSLGRHIVLLSYPLLDILLLGAILAGFALSGFRPGRSWVVLGMGLALFVVVDSVLVTTAVGPYTGDLLVAGWPAAHFLVAFSAWMPAERVRRVASDDWRTALLPVAAVVAMIGIQLAAIFG